MSLFNINKLFCFTCECQNKNDDIIEKDNDLSQKFTVSRVSTVSRDDKKLMIFHNPNTTFSNKKNFEKFNSSEDNNNEIEFELSHSKGIFQKKVTLIGIYDDILFNKYITINNGVNYFFTKNAPESQKKICYKINYKNDYIQHYLFVIFYINEGQSFKLKFNSVYSNYCNDNCKIKLSSIYSIPISSKVYLKIEGKTFLITSLSNNYLEIIILNNNKKYVFNPVPRKEISIGRSEKCSISFPNDKKMEPVHTTITFELSNRSWEIKDGSQSSANMESGSWIFTEDPITIYDGLIIKLWESYVKLSCKKVAVNLR